MRFVGFVNCTLGFALATAMLAGCVALPLSQPALSEVPGAVPQSRMRNVVPQW
jgi:hypothetical protein